MNLGQDLGIRMKKLLMFNPYSSISFSYSPSFLPSLTFYAILLWLRSKIFKYFKYVFVARETWGGEKQV